MSRDVRFVRVSLCLCLTSSLLMPFGSAGAQSQTPVRALAPPDASVRAQFTALPTLRPLPDGRLLVSDRAGRRLMLFDSTLQASRVIADSAIRTELDIAGRGVHIIAYLGDSTLAVDLVSQTLAVLDGNGRVTRVLAAPRASDFGSLATGRVAVDARGNLIYRAAPASAAQTDPGSSVRRTRGPDSVALVRGVFETRLADTIARLKIHVPQELVTTETAGGQRQSKATVFPFSAVDDWAILSGGTVAIIRGADYSVDWIAPDGTLRSSGKLPYAWRRLTDDEKRTLADSAVRAVQSALDSARARAAAAPATGRQLVGARNLVEGTTTALPAETLVQAAPLDAIPDYFPPIRVGTAIGDADGNLWILPLTSAGSRGGGLVYDVVSPAAGLVERVELPRGRSVAGFASGGVVYLAWRGDDLAWRVERTRVERTRVER